MPELTLKLLDDRTSARLTLPRSRDQTMRLSAGEVEALIFQLARLRADMLPARPQTDPTPTTLVHTAPDMRWLVGPEPRPGQLHLALQHPGVGWVAIALDEPRAREMTQRMADVLAASPPRDPPGDPHTVP